MPYKAQGNRDKGRQRKTREGGGQEGGALQTQADAMNPLFAGILLGTLLGLPWVRRHQRAPSCRKPFALCQPPRASGPAPLLSHQETACGAMTAVEAPAAPAKETVTTAERGECCGFLERKPQPDLAQTKLSGNRESSVCPLPPSPSLPPAPTTSVLLASRTFQAQLSSGQIVPPSE